MKILQNAGKFEILGIMTPIGSLDIKQSLTTIEKAGRTCYQSIKEITEETSQKFVQMLKNRHHESVLEHSAMCVKFTDVSRGMTHEQVRHRLAAISQESTRYVDYAKYGDENPDIEKADIKFIVPPDKNIEELITIDFTDLQDISFIDFDGEEHNIKEMKLSITEWLLLIEKWYKTLRKIGWKPEDARQFLLIGLKSEIVVTANFREWRHIFKMRCAKEAHWEIRSIMIKLLRWCQENIPIIFNDFEIIDIINDEKLPDWKCYARIIQ